jgi:hypothetical protein
VVSADRQVHLSLLVEGVKKGICGELSNTAAEPKTATKTTGSRRFDTDPTNPVCTS